jgi:hypothetical protein
MDVIRTYKLQWFGHVERKSLDKGPKNVLKWKWMASIQDVDQRNRGWHDWGWVDLRKLTLQYEDATERLLWRRMTSGRWPRWSMIITNGKMDFDSRRLMTPERTTRMSDYHTQQRIYDLQRPPSEMAKSSNPTTRATTIFHLAACSRSKTRSSAASETVVGDRSLILECCMLIEDSLLSRCWENTFQLRCMHTKCNIRTITKTAGPSVRNA